MHHTDLPKPEDVLFRLRGRLLDKDRNIRNRGLAAGLRRLLLDHPQQHAQGLMALGGAGLGDCVSSVTDKTVIGLFALHPLDNEKGGNFGSSCRALSQPGADDGNPFEKHFRRLLACRTGAAAAPQVARIVRRLKNEGVGVNYYRLLWDLRSWSDRVRENWVRSYFATAEPGHERESETTVPSAPVS